VARRVFTYCLCYNISLASDYVGADVIIKSGADALSRITDHSDCQLHPAIFARLWHACGPFDVDRFASYLSVQCVPGSDRALPYWALFADGQCVGVDALSADWRGVRNYAFPPVALVGQTLLLVQEQRASTVLIVPKWEAHWWWPVLVELAQVLVPLVNLSAGAEQFRAVRPGGPCHPFGTRYPHAAGVEWLVAVIAVPRGPT
jgi:hypothetical protein